MWKPGLEGFDELRDIKWSWQFNIYRNMTFGNKNGEHPLILQAARIASHALVLGPVTIGKNATVAPAVVVIHNVPEGIIAAGVRAKIIGQAMDAKLKF